MRYSITEQRRGDMPAGLPAVWVETTDGLTLYLRDDLPPDLVDHFRRMSLDGPAEHRGDLLQSAR